MFSLPTLSTTVVIHSTRPLFGGLCILNLVIILFISGKTDLLTLWASSLPRLSNKIHSIFVLHFFNAYDVLILFYAVFAGSSYQNGHWGLIMLGLAMFVKRKVLLYTHSLLLLVLNVLTISGVELTLLRAREVTFHLELTTPALPIEEVFEQRTNEVAVMLPWVKGVQIPMSTQPSRPISNMMAVSSRKGGVEKTTAAVNCAYILASMDAGVGVLAANADGPSLPTMVSPEPRILGMNPECLGARLVSLGKVGQGRAVTRGPMVSRVINQLLSAAEWGELYYLFINMPPEHGDIQPTFCQIIPLTAAVIVVSSSDGWQDDCVGTKSSSRSLPASTYLERTKSLWRHGALGASVGTDLSSAAPLNGKDRVGHLVYYNLFGSLRWQSQLMEQGITELEFQPGGVTSILQLNDLKKCPGPSTKELRNPLRRSSMLMVWPDDSDYLHSLAMGRDPVSQFSKGQAVTQQPEQIENAAAILKKENGQFRLEWPLSQANLEEEFVDPHENCSSIQVDSDTYSDSISQFGPARDPHNFEIPSDLSYDEKDESYYLTPIGALDPLGGGVSEEKLVMAVATVKHFHHIEDPGDHDNDGQVKDYCHLDNKTIHSDLVVKCDLDVLTDYCNSDHNGEDSIDLKETFLNECQLKIMGEPPDEKPDSNGSEKRLPVCSNGQGSANTLPIHEATYVAAEDSCDCEVGDNVKTVKGSQEATGDSVANFHLACMRETGVGIKLLIHIEDDAWLVRC
ncbi:hypothetical protein Nepgr_023714 [Nepenthes gracilis]|uniref:Uncharacterized protein n=1 Tax=Nepenthes gracilis TaxID=150966 RepID=A0AAD3XZQ0_NEPGR|nr:hypothetical protein Nepgr_023714 [Nepenthes gracilis]